MATFKAVARYLRTDGYYLIYIRCTHNRKAEYIKTDKYIHHKKVENGEIKDKKTEIAVMWIFLSN